MIVRGDARALPFAAGSVQCCVTSPPYWGLRDYGVDGQLGLERTPDEYVANMVAVFREVWRVLRDDGVLWLNLGDSYAASSNTGGTASKQGSPKRVGAMTARGHSIPAGLKPKDLVGIPWRVAFALQADGWFLRSDIVWSKPNPMPESVTDRPTKAHEYLFLLAKSERYYYDKDAVCEPYQLATLKRGRNARTVWHIPTQPYRDAHFAVMPEKLVEPCIKAGTKPGDLVLDPFAGSGTVGVVAAKLNRRFVGTELNPNYIGMARRRLTEIQPSVLEVC